MEELIKMNMGLVHWQAKRYQWSGAEYDDLVQEGVEGMLVAAKKFDTSRGAKFSTHATWWIRQRISRYAYKFIASSHTSLDAEDRTGRRKIESLEGEVKVDHPVKLDERLVRVLSVLHPREEAAIRRRYELGDVQLPNA